jgi:outer membrane protein with glycine zipper
VADFRHAPITPSRPQHVPDASSRGTLENSVMKRSIRLAVLVIVLAPALLVVAGCRTKAQNGALIGAGAGAVGGYIIGNEMDK